jgi:hypothetical protein
MAEEEEETPELQINERLARYEEGIQKIKWCDLEPWAKVRSVNKAGKDKIKSLIRTNGYSHKFPLTVKRASAAAKSRKFLIADGAHRWEGVGDLSEEQFRQFTKDFEVRLHV